MTDFPMNEWKQHEYPRLRGYAVGEDGEVTTHLCLGLPCDLGCGLDLLIEHPPTMLATELYEIAAQMNKLVSKLPSFSSCVVKAPEPPKELLGMRVLP